MLLKIKLIWNDLRKCTEWRSILGGTRHPSQRTGVIALKEHGDIKLHNQIFIEWVRESHKLKQSQTLQSSINSKIKMSILLKILNINLLLRSKLSLLDRHQLMINIEMKGILEARIGNTTCEPKIWR